MTVRPTETLARTEHGATAEWQAARMPPTPWVLTKSLVPTRDRSLDPVRLRCGPAPLVEKPIRLIDRLLHTPEASLTRTVTGRRFDLARASMRPAAPERRK